MGKEGRLFVLVHGVGHGGWCWYKVAAQLIAAGHRVAALDMGASGVNSKRIDEVPTFADYLEPLMEYMTALPSSECVIVVGHSLGGVAVSVAMEKFPAKIAVAVFATAYMPGPELSLPDIREYSNPGTDFFMDTQFTFEKGPDQPPTSLLFGPKCLEAHLYQHSPFEDLTLATLSVRPSPLYNDSESPEVIRLSKQNYDSVSRVFIISDQDIAISKESQKWMCERNPPDEVREINGSDHMVMFSKPQDLCSHLLDIAEKYH